MLDEIDRKILWRLDLNARISLTALAHEVGLSKQALNYRLKKLTANNYILGYIAIIDIHRLGLLTYRLYFRLAGVSPTKADQLLDHLARHQNTLFVGRMSGSWDAEAVFTVRNFIHFNEILKDLKTTFGKALNHTDLSMTPVVYLFRRDYLLHPTRKYEPLASYGFEPVEHNWDTLDFAILDALATDCRATYDELGERFEVASNTIKGRIKRLEEDHIIRGYRTALNSTALGRTYVKALLKLAPMGRKKEQEFYAACARQSCVVYLTEVLGSWQLEIEAEVESMSDLDDVVVNLRADYPGIITDYNTVTISKELKLNYLPSGKTTKELISRIRSCSSDE